MKHLLLLVVIYQTSLMNPVVAEEKKPTGIVLNDCTLTLIDKVTLASDRIGILKQINFKEGDKVQKKALVAQLNNDVAIATANIATQLSENEVDISLAEKSHEVAKAEHNQQKELSKQSATTSYLLLRAQLSEESTALEIKKAKNEKMIRGLQAKEADARLKEYDIIAPFSGIITQRYKNVGDAVQYGEAILDIVNLDRLRIEGDLPLKYAWTVKPGTPVIIQLNLPEGTEGIKQRQFKGKIVFVDVAVKTSASKVRVWAEINNKNHQVLPGLFCTMTILNVQAKKNVVSK